MHDWILGLQKAATTYGPGVSEEALGAIETEAGEALPAELRSLYLGLDGADFPSDVTLYPLRAREGTPGVLEQTRAPAVDALPRRGIWQFGRRGFGEHLFASLKRELAESGAGAELPGWLGTLPDGAWVFGLMSADTGELSLFRTLEHLLWTLIPPAETEEFGENTFARALSAVETAMDALERPGAKRPSPARKTKPAAKKGSQRKQARPAPRKVKAAKRGSASKKPRRSTRASKPPRRRR